MFQLKTPIILYDMIKSYITSFTIFTILLLSSCDKELNRSSQIGH